MTTKTTKRRGPPAEKKGPVIIPPQFSREEVLAFLRSMREGDEEDRREQQETFEALKRGIDENRLPGYKLFE